MLLTKRYESVYDERFGNIVTEQFLLLFLKGCENWDKTENCDAWASLGNCDSNSAYMLNNCKKSCAVC